MTERTHRHHPSLTGPSTAASALAVLLLGVNATAGCSSGSTNTTTAADGGGTTNDDASTDAGESTAEATRESAADAAGDAKSESVADSAVEASGDSGTVAVCEPTYVNSVLAAISTFESAIGTTLTAATEYDDAANTTSQLDVYKTDWSNLPPGAIQFSRPGIILSQLSSASQINAFNALVSTALSAAGYTDYQGVLAADDYLGYTKNANGYGANLYHVAVVGTPSKTGLWTLMFGGHHLAFNITFNQSCSYPTPHHIGVEPRTPFTSNDHYTSTYGTAVYTSGAYQVLSAKAAAMFAVFTGLDPEDLASAFLTGQKFNDILIGPVEANTGSYANVTAKFDAIASSANRGVLVSTLSSGEQALVTATIQSYVNDYDPSTATRLLADYEAGYENTYVAWANAAGTESSAGPDVTTSGTYMRIDGPRVWIEIAVQSGIVIQTQTHYHMMFRDKTYDYFNELGGAGAVSSGDAGSGETGGPPSGEGGLGGEPPGDGGIGGPHSGEGGPGGAPEGDAAHD